MKLVERLRVPVVAAPMAGGPSTPELVAAVWEAGGFGFLAGGMLAAAALEDQIRRASSLGCEFGVNLFAPHPQPASLASLEWYAARHGVSVPVGVDVSDGWVDKFEVVLRSVQQGWGPRVLSVTFGLFDAQEVQQLHALGVEAWATVASAGDAVTAVGVGVDTLVVQGPDAGGHRATWLVEQQCDSTPLGALVALDVAVPVVAAGGLSTAAQVAEALSWPGVAAVACGTAFLLADEAGTSQAHRELVRGGGPTAVTRAFSGRWARGVETQFMRENTDAPAMYPHVNVMMGPLRRSGDPRYVAAWAGTGLSHAMEASAGEVVRNLYPRAG